MEEKLLDVLSRSKWAKQGNVASKWHMIEKELAFRELLFPSDVKVIKPIEVNDRGLNMSLVIKYFIELDGKPITIEFWHSFGGPRALGEINHYNGSTIKVSVIDEVLLEADWNEVGIGSKTA